VPRCRAVGLAKRFEKAALLSLGIPIPVLPYRKWTIPAREPASAGTTVTITSPSAVNLTAFPMRFTRICRSLVTVTHHHRRNGLIQFVGEV